MLWIKTRGQQTETEIQLALPQVMYEQQYQQDYQDMQTHHYNWLQAHPYRDGLWLRKMTAEGFQVHHIDGNHGNNNPQNLALIYGPDHSAMHRNFLPFKGKKQRFFYGELFMGIFFILYIILRGMS